MKVETNLLINKITIHSNVSSIISKLICMRENKQPGSQKIKQRGI
jgi:hypothetical protein